MNMKKITASVLAGVLAISTLATAAFATETKPTTVTRNWEQWDAVATSTVSFTRSLNNVTEQRGIANTLTIATATATAADDGAYAVYVTKAELDAVSAKIAAASGETLSKFTINGVAPIEVDDDGAAPAVAGTGTGYAVILDEDGTITAGEIKTADAVTITLEYTQTQSWNYATLNTAVIAALNAGLDFDFAIGAKKGNVAQLYPARFVQATDVKDVPFVSNFAVTYVQGNIIGANQTAETKLSYEKSKEGLLSTLEAYSFINGASGKLAVNFAAAQEAIGKVVATVTINGKDVSLDTAIADEGATAVEFAIPADALGLYIQDAAVQFWTVAVSYNILNKTGKAIKSVVLTVEPAEEEILVPSEVIVPVEEPGDNTDTEKVDDTPAADENAPTGVALAVIPALVAGAAVVASRKRK